MLPSSELTSRLAVLHNPAPPQSVRNLSIRQFKRVVDCFHHAIDFLEWGLSMAE
jgi:hypothetical protein